MEIDREGSMCHYLSKSKSFNYLSINLMQARSSENPIQKGVKERGIGEREGRSERRETKKRERHEREG